LTINRVYDLAQPQFTGSGTNSTWGFFYEAKFSTTYSISLLSDVVTADLWMAPGYSFAPSDDGHVTVTNINQNVTTLNDLIGIKESVQTALRNDAVNEMSTTINGQLDQPVAKIASMLNFSLATPTCDPTVDLAEQQRVCYLAAFPLLVQFTPNGGLLPKNFACMANKQCSFHPIVQAVNALPDSLELVFAPDLSNPSNPDFLTSLYQTVDGIQRASGGFHMCSDRPAETVSSGTPSLMWHGKDGVFNTACGALLQ
jgi:hypothetical protein